MRKYQFVRGGDFPTRATVSDGCIHTPIRPRRDLWNFMDQEFEWSIGSAGCCQLALAILADALRNDGLALELAMSFAEEILAEEPSDSFHLHEECILRWCIRTMSRGMGVIEFFDGTIDLATCHLEAYDG